MRNFCRISQLPEAPQQIIRALTQPAVRDTAATGAPVPTRRRNESCSLHGNCGWLCHEWYLAHPERIIPGGITYLTDSA